MKVTFKKTNDEYTSSVFNLNTTEEIPLKLSFDRIIEGGNERYRFQIYCPREHLEYRMVEMGELWINSFSRDEAIELWKAMGEIIKQEIEEN